MCPSSYEPVVCQVSGQECEYQNLCSADVTIGVETSNCVLAEKQEIQGEKVLQKLLYLRNSRMITSSNDCPSDMEDGTACSMFYDPVICQVNGQQCEYSNSCIANSTIGVEVSNCTAVSEVQDKNLPFSSPNSTSKSLSNHHIIDACRIVMPLPGTPLCKTPGNVICGIHDCIYSDICEANLSGYDESECLKLASYIDSKTVITTNFKCPSNISEDVVCPMHIDPVTCQVQGHTCEYSNSCFASATVGVDSTSCSPKQTDNTGCKIVMPLPNTPPCNEDAKVICGEKKCLYTDICEAKLSGYSETQCTSVSENGNNSLDDNQGANNLSTACPDNAVAPTTTACTQSGNVICGTLMCRYDDICVARHNGFNDTECSLQITMQKKPSNDFAKLFGN